MDYTRRKEAQVDRRNRSIACMTLHATLRLLVVGVGGVGVSTDDVLDLVHDTLLVSTGSLQVVVDSGSGLLSAGKTGSIVVLVSRVGSVSLGEVITVSGQSAQLVVVGALVTDGVAVLGVEPVGTGSTSGYGSVVVASLEAGDSLVANSTGSVVSSSVARGALVKVPSGGVGTVGGRVGTSGNASTGVSTGQTTSVSTVANGSVVVVVILVTGNRILELLANASVVIVSVSDNVLASSVRRGTGLLEMQAPGSISKASTMNGHVKQLTIPPGWSPVCLSAKIPPVKPVPVCLSPPIAWSSEVPDRMSPWCRVS
jgi:hypothetical protein